MGSDLSDSTLEDLRDNQEELRTLAESDLRVSKYASRLLECIGGDTSYSTNEPREPDTSQSDDSERSLLAH